MQCTLILLAAGSGSRMRGQVADKVLATLGGESVFLRGARAFVNSGAVDGVVVVYRDAVQLRLLQAEWQRMDVAVPVRWVVGGSERQDSVRSALAVLADSVGAVLIHDAARPLICGEQIVAVAAALDVHPAVVLAHRVTDTIKQVTPCSADSGAMTLTDLDRSRLWAMETPQGFHFNLIARAYALCAEKITDDTAAVALLGASVVIVENPHPNPKITQPADLQWAEFLLNKLEQNEEY